MDIDEAMEKFGNSFRDAKRGPQAQAELFNMYGAALSRAEAAEHRVAELEARLAEQGWRPVTEDAPTYMIVDLLVTGYNTEDGYRVGPDNTDVIKAWRPSQPESAATE